MNTSTPGFSTTIKKLTPKDVAALAKKTLTEKFPGVKFSAKSHSYSGGSSVRVSWVDGPTLKEVDKLVGHMEGATFDGMTDMMSYKEDRLVATGENTFELISYSNDWIKFDRELSAEFEAELAVAAAEVARQNGYTEFAQTGLRYKALGTDHGTFRGGRGIELIRYLAEFTAR